MPAEQVDATRQRIIGAAVAGFAPWAAELPFDKVAERARVSERTVFAISRPSVTSCKR